MMKKSNSNIVTAPQIIDTSTALSRWTETHNGSAADFLEFMTTPTPERESWCETVGESLFFNGTVAATVIDL